LGAVASSVILESEMTGLEDSSRRAVWLTVFALSMGLFEAAVVVYLRELYYPEGFRFPLVALPVRIAAVEVVREATTLFMLLAVAVVSGRDRIDRFFVFGYMFGVWDLVYYAGLRLFLDWPSSLLTWDVLFLIPLPWLGPVLYPVSISCLLIVGFVVAEVSERRGRPLRPTTWEWLVAIGGAVVVVVAFCWNWKAVSEMRTPGAFPAALCCGGILLGVLPFIRATLRARGLVREA
jgi:hypothetical protein